MPVRTLDHPLVCDRLTQLRDHATPSPRFRALLEELSFHLAVEATKGLLTQPVGITTPVGGMQGERLSESPIVAPVLRAALGMLPGFLRLLEEATVAHLGFFRDATTLAAVPYYANLPEFLTGRPIFVLDPMLATGASAVAALELLEAHGADRVSFVGLVAAPEGIAALERRFPRLDIVVAAIDQSLDDHGYIVPGLGDAGDRQFATETSTPVAYRSTAGD